MTRRAVPDPGAGPREELPPTQPMCAKHWWATLGPDGKCPICAAQAGR
ncbi:hypothetical protein [Naasia sp. SYSU D00057]|nr:hypothetical protein [Naasia sp. SYSU D00057]